MTVKIARFVSFAERYQVSGNHYPLLSSRLVIESISHDSGLQEHFLSNFEFFKCCLFLPKGSAFFLFGRPLAQRSGGISKKEICSGFFPRPRASLYGRSISRKQLHRAAGEREIELFPPTYLIWIFCLDKVISNLALYGPKPSVKCATACLDAT